MMPSEEEPKFETGRFPTIFIAGTPKCGTTTLNAVLKQHIDISGGVWRDPEVTVSRYTPNKEHFFFNFDGNYEKGLDWYAKHFRLDVEHAIDATPNTITDEIALGRIAEVVPDAKFIILMREPVARAFSAWNHWNQILPEETRWPMAVPNGTFEDQIAAEKKHLDTDDPGEGFLAQGIYAAQLRRLYRFFPKENVFCCFSAHLRLDPHDFMRRIQEFLGVIPLEFRFKDRNRRTYTVAPMSSETYRELRDFMRPFDRDLQDFLGVKLPWEI